MADGLNVDVRSAEGVRQSLNELGADAGKALVSSINRTARDLRSRLVARTTQTYNIGRKDLLPYVVIRSATRTSVSATVKLQIRAIPIEAFKPRVRLQKYTYSIKGQTVTRRLASIYIKRYRQGAAKLLRPAFPLTQRETGPLRPGEEIRRRISAARDRLTRIRYYTFPRQFVEKTLLPDALAFIPERVGVELRRALRKYDKRGHRALRGNRS